MGISNFTEIKCDSLQAGVDEELLDSGAISIKCGVVALNKSGAIAATIADPVATTDDFKRITILSLTAQAHTLAPGTSFGNGGSGENLATFSGVIGDNISLIAYQGKWYIIGSHQVTVT